MLEIGRYYDMDDIRLRHRQAGGHWFDADTLRFFRSRVGSRVWPVSDGWLFVSSEQFASSQGQASPRRYTIRKVRPDLRIETIGDFQQYASRSGAVAAVERLVRADRARQAQGGR